MNYKEYPEVNVVIPLFNERETFHDLIQALSEVIDSVAYGVRVILVDDGSTDGTADLMRELALSNPNFQAIILSRNFGHQLAITAGLQQVDATKAVMVMDGDLQDPPEMLHQFMEYFEKGYDVVYAVRKVREASVVMRFLYKLFYRLIKKVSYINIPLDSGDFSLMSRRVVDSINAMPEESRFIRGMRSWVGFKQIGVPYKRGKREKGESKYGMKDLWHLAINGLFNFSYYPIRLALIPGFIALFVSVTYFVVTLVKKIFIGNVPLGFTGILFTVILFGGIQLIAIGVIGEYILKIYFQSKNRPNYIVKEQIKGCKVIE